MDTFNQYVLGPVLVGIVGLIGVVLTRRQAKTAHATSQETPQGISTADQATIAGLVTTVGHLAGRVEALEERATKSERLVGVASAYVARLLDFIAHIAPGRTDVPEPPEDLREHLPR